VSDPNPNFNFNINTNPTGSPTLGSYSHSHKKKNFKAAIKEARWILIAVGALIMLGNFVVTFMQWNQVEKEIDAEIRRQTAQLGPGEVADPASVEEFRNTARLGVYILLGLVAAVGLILIALGLTVHLAPVPIAISALAIYIGYHAILYVLDSNTVVQGWIIKIIVIACLIKVINSARSYQNDLRTAERELEAQGRPMPLQ
jgi:hypothetical protein